MHKNIKHLLFALVAFLGAGIVLHSPAEASALIDSVFGDDAQFNASNISQNIVSSVDRVPGLVSAISFLLALLFGTTGIVKLKEHVEMPQQVRLIEPVARFLAGGVLLGLPIFYEAMQNMIGGGGLDSQYGGTTGFLSSIIGIASSFIPSQDVNQILSNIIESLEGVPALIAAIAYISGLILGVWGVLNIKEHMESPQNNPPLREGVGRIFVGGLLFALPTVYEAMANSIRGDGFGVFDVIGDIFGTLGMLFPSSGGGAFACSDVSVSVFGSLGAELLGTAESNSVGGVLCNVMMHTGGMQGFLVAISTLLGMVFGIWGIFKLRDYVVNPQQSSAWDIVSRFAAAGAFFSLPVIIRAAINTVGSAMAPHTVTGFNDGTTSGNFFENMLNSIGLGGLFGLESGEDGAGAGGLDAMLVNFMQDIYGPMTSVMNWFGYLAGTIFILIGISRLIKTSQDGPRGPGGLGTLITFFVGGALLAFSPMVSAFSMSLFNNPTTYTYATLAHTTGMDPEVVVRTHAVISAVIKFMIVVGLISIMRGFFLLRGVAEGQQQASLMASVTHLVGGALAVNLGPLMNAVQSTLGLTDYGIVFG